MFRSSLQIFEDHYHFDHKEIRKRSVNPSHHHQNRLNNDDRVHWSKQQRIKSRQKRDFLSFHNPEYASFATGKNRVATTDPKWSQMWYLVSEINLSITIQYTASAPSEQFYEKLRTKHAQLHS